MVIGLEYLSQSTLISTVQFAHISAIAFALLIIVVMYVIFREQVRQEFFLREILPQTGTGISYDNPGHFY